MKVIFNDTDLAILLDLGTDTYLELAKKYNVDHQYVHALVQANRFRDRT